MTVGGICSDSAHSLRLLGQKIKEMEQKKGFLLEALARKAFALLGLKDESSPHAFDKVIKQLQSWIDLRTTGKFSSLYIEHEIRVGHFGCALTMINKLLLNETKESEVIHSLTKSELFAKRAGIYEALGYHVLTKYDEKTRLVACPNDYAPF